MAMAMVMAMAMAMVMVMAMAMAMVMVMAMAMLMVVAMAMDFNMNTKEINPPTLSQVHKILNEVGTTWKVRRALLREIGVKENLIKELVPEPQEGFEYKQEDY